MNKELRTGILVFLTLVSIFFSKKAMSFKPPKEALTDDGFYTKIIVWYWPFNSGWKAKVKPGFHDGFAKYQKYAIPGWISLLTLIGFAIFNEFVSLP